MTKEISVFVDESGSFAPAGSDLHSPCYLLCMVFHDQSDDITAAIAQLREAFMQMGLDADCAVHAGPMIRREEEYRTMPRELRIRIFRRMMVFIQKANFTYKCFKLFKPYNSGEKAITWCWRCSVLRIDRAKRREMVRGAHCREMAPPLVPELVTQNANPG